MRPAQIAAAMALVTACGGEEPPAPMPDPAEARITDATTTAAGEIAGEPWELADARFRVVTRAGRERVDLLLWDRPIESCGLPIERDGTVVWLRFPGRTSLEVGELVLEGEEGELEVHYEVPDERGFTAVHRGVATVRVEVVEAQSVRGSLRVCFADAEQSCVGGTFDAAPCLSRIDGRMLREAPGLANEALEPSREAP